MNTITINTGDIAGRTGHDHGPSVVRAARRALMGLALCAGLVSAAHADVWVREASLGAGQASGSLTLPVGTSNYWAGFQNIEVSATSNGASPTSFAAYCIDSFHYSSTNFNPNYTPSATHSVTSIFSSQATDIQNLFNKYYAGTVSNAANAAAFQLALWEIANDDKNLNTGVVRVNGATSPGLVSGAAALLGNLAYAGPDMYSLTLYQVNRTSGGVGQDYIVATPTVTPVPEPSTLALLGIGLLALGSIAKRRVT